MELASEYTAPRLRFAPAPLTLFLVAIAAVSVALAFTKGLQDPDFFWHLETGEVIAESGRIPTTDPFSFTWGGQPWTTHEWLGQLVIYGVVTRVGNAGALLVFSLLPPLTLAVGAASARRLGAPTRAVVAAVIVTGAVLVPYVTVRPQVASWLMLAVVVALLANATSRRWATLLVLPPLFALWASLHGLYVVGLGCLALYGISTLLGATSMASHRLRTLSVFVACLLASAVTPNGIAGLLYPLRYLDGSDWGLANIPEWQSPNFHDLVQVPLLILIVVIAVAAWRLPRDRWWLSVLAYGGVVAALFANRNVPVAAVLAMPAVALGLGSILPVASPARHSPVARRAIEVVATALVVVGSLRAAALAPGGGEVIHTRYPAQAVDVLAQSAPNARVVVEYGWAGYVIHSLHDDGISVFVDGRNDMYPEEILRAYSLVRAADPGWESVIEEYAATALLFPPAATIVKGPAQAQGWCEAYRDDAQVLLVRCEPA